MPYKFQLTLVFKLYYLFWMINDMYESLKTKNDH